MANLDKDFDKEKNLDAEFDAEPSRGVASQPAGPPPGIAEAIARGAGKGVTFGAQAPLAGAGAALTQAVTGNQGPVPGRNLPALMAAYQQMKNEQIQKNAAAQQAHPIAFGGAELAGALPTTIATGGTAPGLATAATQGAAAGLGNYVGSTQDPTVKGATIATGAGLMGGTMLHQAAPGLIETAGDIGRGAVNKIKGILPNTIKQGADLADQGVNVLSKDAQGKVLADEANKSADSFTKRILNVKNELVGDTMKPLQEATDGEMIIDHDAPFAGEPDGTPEMQHFSPEDMDNQMSSDIDELGSQDQGDEEQSSILAQGPKLATPSYMSPFDRANNAFSSLEKKMASYADPSTDTGQAASQLKEIITQNKHPETAAKTSSELTDQYGRSLVTPSESEEGSEMRTQLSPLETHNLMKETYNFADVLANQGKPGMAPLVRIARDFANGMKDRLRSEIPEYATAADRLNQFQKYLPETLMSKGQQAADTDVSLSDGDSYSQYQDLKDPIETMLHKLEKKGLSTQESKQVYNRLDESLDNLSTLENARQSEADLKGDPFSSVWEKMNMNKDQVMDFLRDKAKKVAAYDTMETGNIPLSMQAASDLAGKTGLVAGNVAQRAKTAISNVGGVIYNAPKDVLYAAATKLEKNPATAALAAGLRSAVASGDIVKQNAAIFAILQNPTAKYAIDPNIKDSGKESSTQLPKRSPYNTEF